MGDALGTPLEFTDPGQLTPIADMVRGGPFALRPGQRTDDTSLALCLAEGLLERAASTRRGSVQRLFSLRWEGWGTCGLTVRGGGRMGGAREKVPVPVAAGPILSR